MMWIRWLQWSAVRIRPWLSVVIPIGSNDSLEIALAGGPVYLNLSLPALVTTTTVLALLSATHISWFLHIQCKNHMNREAVHCHQIEYFVSL